MTREEAIKQLESMRKGAVVVLDSGFGTHPGESDTVYRNRKELAEFCLVALREQEEHRWIPVTERLPNEKGEYLVAFHPCWWDDVKWDKFCVGTDTFRGKTAWAKKKFQRVTHWMPLPEPPKGD